MAKMKTTTQPKKVKKTSKKVTVAKPTELKAAEVKKTTESPASVSWQGNQPGYYKRSGWWYLIATLITAALLVYAYKDKNNSFLFLIIALYALILAKSAQGPQTVYFSLSQDELSINSDERRYDLKVFGGYYTIEGNDVKYIGFRYPDAAHEDIIIPIDSEKLENAVSLLKQTELKEDLTAREPMVHYLSRVLKI
ncbi:MAG TPA: hypothetical protein PLX10_02095 [Candidatus Paceibacterota bacterium]|nr:hypothetical protein [Candidatus Paceibacterota bacterium]